MFFKYPNPIFCIPIGYFQHGRFLCEIARTETLQGMFYGQYNPLYKSPLEIFKGLFVDDGLWITVLECTGRNQFVHRTDLSEHISDERELNSFINRLNY